MAQKGLEVAANDPAKMLCVAYEKPMEHIPKTVFIQRLKEIQEGAAKMNDDSYQLRHDSRHMRTEGNIRSKWNTYQTNLRLNDRLTEVSRWKEVLESCLKAVQKEIMTLKVEKNALDAALETVVNTPLSVVSECITLRDGRRGNDLNQDDAYDELNKERDLVEALKTLVSAKCQESWVQLNRLGAEEFQLQLDISNKEGAREIEMYNLDIDRFCAGTSYKTNPLRTPDNCCPYEDWLETSRANKKRSEDAITRAIQLREEMCEARDRSFNALKRQHDVTDFTLRKQVYEIQRAKNELEYQRKGMRRELTQISQEIATLEESLRGKTNALKLASTRLENRMGRSGPELVEDPGQLGLKDEVRKLREIREQLIARIDKTKGMYTELYNSMRSTDIDLDNKCHALMTDLRVIDTRKRLLTMEKDPKALKPIDVQLTRMEAECVEGDR